MNNNQLRKLGVPDDCIPAALTAIQAAAKAGELKSLNVKKLVRDIVSAPDQHTDHPYFGGLATSIIEDRQFEPAEPIEYRTWGEDIDQAAHAQMRQACSVPSAVGAALMPDAHVGYGLPIGGVLACENAVIPYAVGVDIACRMKLSILDMPTESLKTRFEDYRTALEKGTRFGIGAKHKRPQEHAVMDADWSITRVTRENKDKAWRQLGTSGSGNHFAEFGVFTLPVRDEELNLDAGEYVALMTHSGSRGTGASVCSTYSAIAQAKLPRKYKDLGRLAWLDLDSPEGQDYWNAMNLMGDYAAANHDVIHRLVSKLLGVDIISGVENHHNFAWKEVHDGKEVIVHRKGATPASAGELGVIPGSMADPAFVVRGTGHAASLRSASHGAGRQMSRKKAKAKFTFNAVRKDLEKKGIRILSAGADEVPGVYKDINTVMQQQADLVEIVGRFNPRIVKMCGDNSRAED
ncbi:RtcB family protein [Thalassoroseus pseudoceratinae]|uniref:RtcB family protein n=1 Tax=Thalassoroseus pseudoceratinae TaxID=2713176 RepID=UPI00141F1F8D|nr:RtcB family protein [Thalassoroseus pseudoceratinae]